MLQENADMTALYHNTVCLNALWEKELISDRINLVGINMICQIKAEAK